MYYHVYVSSAVELFTAAQLVELLESSRASNAILGVTGMLLYKDGNFMQALEGERDVVLGLMARIKRDPRHRGILSLLSDDLPERQFSRWSMGFRDLRDAGGPRGEGYSEFMNSRLSAEEFREDPTRAQRLLLMFRRSM